MKVRHCNELLAGLRGHRAGFPDESMRWIAQGNA
jgi:hypothetical protein